MNSKSNTKEKGFLEKVRLQEKNESIGGWFNELNDNPTHMAATNSKLNNIFLQELNTKRPIFGDFPKKNIIVPKN